jgi:hypothetical protein
LTVVPAPAAERETDGEANDHLETIERHLTILEAEFGPAVAPNPAADYSDPFGEHFAEDEVIIDRYASLDSGGIQQRRHVFCHEGNVLSKLLRHAAPAEVLGVVQPPAAAQPAATITTAAPAGPPPTPPAVTPARIEPPPVEEDDADQVVVEEDPHVLPVPTQRPPARREEYRRLFAKLRRG